MTSYDDAEGMLQDQGLEVVVIPYRPSPPPRPPLPPKRQYSRDENDGKKTNRRPLASPASDESKTCDDDDAGTDPNVLSPPSRKSLFTPRSRAAVDEALGQKLETTPPPLPKQQPLKTNASSKPLTGKNNDKQQQQGEINNKKTTGANNKKSAPARSHSAGPPQSTNNANAKSTKKVNKSTPPRLRSKSNPSSAKKTKGGRNPHEKMGFYQMAKLGYQELCNAIIRPPRSDYPLDALGPEEFVFCGEKFMRKDFGVVNERGLLVECSIWKKAHEEEEIGTLGGKYECEQQQKQNNDSDGNDENECGQITLNVDDWDENKERGQMYLHVPDSFEEASTASSALNDDDKQLDDDDDDDSVDSLIRRASSMLDDDDSSDDESVQDSAGMMKNLQHQHSESTAHTYYQGSVKTRKRRRDPVVIYMHGNSSSRTEVIPQLGHLLSLGVSVVAFDFAGSGKSEGEFVSLGFYEREDLQTVIHHLRATGDVSTIALWGRSMGAATAIMYGSRDPTISCMIVDSSFVDLTRLAEEMVEKGKEQGVNVPNFVVSVALRMIKSSIKSQAGFSIRHISPISHVNRCFVPAMFVAGEHDDFINKRHSERLHAKYAGDKNIVIIDGDHNSPRPRFLLQSACLFLQSCMQLPPSLELVVPLGTNLLAPPWICPGTFSRLGLAEAIAKARAGVSSSSDERSWVPLNDTAQQKQQQQLQRQRSQPPPASRKVSIGDNPQPGLSLEKGNHRSRSCTDSSSNEVPSSPTAAELLAASAPPDMTERQKEIQSSL
eukprot:CAMPEP_0172308426 /NCGR_PEP_ID=MMETSP1058-20130122/9015_1 /TAXON_ID=83371 /ORGANISM="Detonula confervacea, Strain CCMP 353" /LENGTH=774 /DNA_ID=CAMNT_0013020835 /DNA_START=134 /DNA_END=2455 /DNA_ORIENTATION=+